MSKRSNIVKTLVFLTCTLGISSTSLSDNYHFASIELLAEQEVARLVLPKIYQQLDQEITIVPLPAPRAQFEANSGMKDGEILRIYSYGEENKNVQRVPTPYYELTTAVFALEGKHIKVKDVKDLSLYRVGKVRGVKHTENATKNISNVYDSLSTKHLFSQLALGNVDIAITNYRDGLLMMKKMPQHDFIVVNKAIAYEPLYHYIHESHAHLVAPVNNVIKLLKESGELSNLLSEAEKIIYSH